MESRGKRIRPKYTVRLTVSYKGEKKQSIHEWTFKSKEASFFCLRNQGIALSKDHVGEKGKIFKLEWLDPNGNLLAKNLTGDREILARPPEGRELCLELLHCLFPCLTAHARELSEEPRHIRSKLVDAVVIKYARGASFRCS
jgi:hypothetical protein